MATQFKSEPPPPASQSILLHQWAANPQAADESPSAVSQPWVAEAVPPKSSTFFSRERPPGNAVAFLCSLVFHTALLLVLACWVFSAGKRSQGLLINAEVGESQQTSLDQLQTFELAMDEPEEPRFESEPEFRVDLDIESPLANSAQGAKTTLTSVSLDQVIEDLKPKGKGRGASFFGAYAEGNRFIYVLDSSRSMTGDRWTYACTQLLDSLSGLKPGQEFFVICFDFETTFLFNASPAQAKYFEADEETVGRVKNWLRSRILGQATMPATALQYALNFGPDAIFLLSDGELQDNSMMMLRRINSNVSETRQIPIHTIHLFSLSGKETLRQIAKENQGTFTPIEGQRGFGRFRRR